MKHSYFSRIVALISVCSLSAFSATAVSVSTDPVSVISYTFPPLSDISIGVPVMRPPVFEGRVASVDTVNSTITFEGSPNWVANGLVTVAPHYVLVKTGVDEGMWLTVNANTTDTVSVTLRSVDTLENIVVGEIAAVVPHWTPTTLFGDAPEPMTYIFFYRSAIPGINQAASLTLSYLLVGWYDIARYNNHSNVPINPDEGMIIRNNSANPFTLTVSGVLPMTRQRSMLRTVAASQVQDQHLAYMSAVPQKVGDVNIPAENGDIFFIYDHRTGFNHASSTTLTFLAGNWYNLRNFSNVSDTLELKPGSAFIYRKAATVEPELLIWRNQPAYLD